MTTLKKQRINTAVDNLIASMLFEDKKSIKRCYKFLMRETTFCKNQKLILNY